MESSLGVLSDIALKTTLLLTIAALVTATMHRRAAAARHMVWALALGSALALPAISVIVPVWSISIPHAMMPTSMPNVPVSADVPHAGYVNHAPATQLPAIAPQPVQSVTPVSSPRPTSWSDSPSTASSVSWPPIALVVWLAGMLIVVAHLAVGAVTAHRLLRRAAVVTDERWTSLFGRTKAQLWLRRRVVLVQSERVTTPAAWGIFHPIVVVPVAADDWNDVQRHAVLLHELAHVERWDCLTHVLAQLACAVHWFNPLAWWAKHRLNTERERACDDRALGQVTRPSSYAEQLMTVAYSYRGRHRQPVGSLAMAKQSQLEDRVRRILDRAQQRGDSSRSAAAMFGSIAACLIVPLAAFHPYMALEQNTAERSVSRAVSQSASRSVSPSVSRSVSGAVSHATPNGVTDTLVSNTDDVHWTGMLPAGDTIEIKNLAGAIRAEPATGDRIEIVARRYAARDNPKAVQIQLVKREHAVVLCSIYPGSQTTQTCDGYDGDLKNFHCNRDCSDARVDWIVRVPADIRLSAHTVAGNITAAGLGSDVEAHSVGGSVNVSTSGHVSAFTMERMNVSMGRTDWSGDLKLYAGSSLTVTLPAKANTTLEAASTFGSVQSDFPLQQSDHNHFGTKASGTVGTGGRTLRLQTLGGPITILNAAAPASSIASGGEPPVAQHRYYPQHYYRDRRDSVHVNVDSIVRASRSYARIDNARIQATVRRATAGAVAGADFAATVSASLRAADISGRVQRAMKAARISETVDSAMRAARISETVDSAMRAAHISEKVSDAMRAAFGDSTAVRSRPRDK